MYYYKGGIDGDTYKIEDNYYGFHNNTPHKLFVEENNIQIWWHVNDRTKKIDMNINLVDKDIRKEALSTR